MTLSNRLRFLADQALAEKLLDHREWLISAADLLDATTPRPWPPPDGVTRCLGWRNKTEGWFIIALEAEFVTGEPAWRGCGVIAVNRFQPKLWLPMPPEPEVGG